MAKEFKYQCGECGSLYMLEVIVKGVVKKLVCVGCGGKYKPPQPTSRYVGGNKNG